MASPARTVRDPMIRNRLYYAAKPFIPRWVRIALRRHLARRQRRSHADTWPIDERAAAVPAHWKGWPNGKQFSFVLTHDVESASGLAKVRKLAELELNFGVRSSYNFIPEGPYRVPAALRTWLVDHGFEIGIHDLRHDGKLLSSPERFRRNARHINGHLRDWNAVGFRAAFMLHNLDWFRELSIAYDLSTFDTDPFEPQPTGARTVFPFLVLANSNDSSARPSTAYVELPYTLPQDSTLFIVLEETTPKIWIEKLDWIAANRGMALVNVHPDYVQFSDDIPNSDTYPADHYAALIEHLQTQHSGKFWHALPRDVADWAASMPAPNGNELSNLKAYPENASRISDETS